MSASTWLMEPSALAIMLEQRERVSFDTAEALQAFGSAPSSAPGYDVVDSVAIIKVHGVLQPRGDLWSYFFGGAITEEIGASLRRALASSAISAIVLDISSPGGLVEGTQALAHLIAQADKPVHALVTGGACSAGYWIASQCDVIAASPSAIVGCLGVVQLAIASGPSRIMRFTSSMTPRKNAPADSEEGAAERQQLVDDLARSFLSDVAKARGLTSAESAAKAYGEGATFAASRALEMGMVDQLTAATPADYARTLTTTDRKAHTMAKSENTDGAAIKGAAEKINASTGAAAQAVADPPSADIAALQAERDQAKADAARAQQQADEARAEADRIKARLHEQTRDGLVAQHVDRGALTPAAAKLFAAAYDNPSREAVAALGAALGDNSAIDLSPPEGSGAPPPPSPSASAGFESKDEAINAFTAAARKNRSTYAAERDAWIEKNPGAAQKFGFID